MKFILTSLFVLLLTPLNVFAEEKDSSFADSTKITDESIPIQLDTVKAKSTEESFATRAVTVFSFVVILGLISFIFFKKYVHKNTKKSQEQIKILTQHYLGPKKSLAIIRVAGESILIGVTEQNINMIKSLSLLDEDIPEQTPKQFANLVEDEDFYFKGIKDTVSEKIRTLKGI